MYWFCVQFFFKIINMAYVIDMKQKLLIMLTFRTTVEIKKRYTEKQKKMDNFVPVYNYR